MNIGLSTASFYPQSTENTVNILKQLGVKKAEVFLEAQSESRPEFYRPLKKAFDDAGTEIISVHGFVAMYEPFLFSEYKRRAEDAFYEFEKIAEAGAYLGAKYYTFHGNRLEYYKPSFDFKEYAKVFTRLCRAAKSHGLTLAWENVSWCQSASIEFLSETSKLVDPALYGYTLDLKQARRAGISYDTYLELMADRLLNIHISDYNTESSCILPGRGAFDFKELFKKLGSINYKGDLITEVYSDCYAHVSEVKAALDYLEEIKNEQ